MSRRLPSSRDRCFFPITSRTTQGARKEHIRTRTGQRVGETHSKTTCWRAPKRADKRVFLEEVTARAKAQRWAPVWGSGGTERELVWLGQGGEMGPQREMRRGGWRV